MKRKIGATIRRMRLQKNFTQQYLAKRLGLSVLSYGKIERGHTDITLTRLDEIAKVLDTFPATIIVESEISETAASSFSQSILLGESPFVTENSEETFSSLAVSLIRVYRFLAAKRSL